MLWHIGPLTEHCKPPTVESLIDEEILKKPVNMLFCVTLKTIVSFLSSLLSMCMCYTLTYWLKIAFVILYHDVIVSCHWCNVKTSISQSIKYT